ncbi:MAG TPA: radical SAM protein [Bacteroidales bacterium]|nr:radical SAM protein [Bacteroidales bacterium]
MRISVTDRCNLKCLYCIPVNKEIKYYSSNEILTFEEITSFTEVAIEKGINKVRITGGEPLVRNDIVKLVEMLAKLKGIKDLSLTTNGTLLKHFAKHLKQAGLNRINISLDTLSRDKFKMITQGGELNDVIEGIMIAKQVQLLPIKINCVIEKSSQEKDAIQIKEFCKDNGLEVRFIKRMDLNNGIFSIVEGGSGGNCLLCNRIRLTANGMLKPCLFSNIEFDIRKLGYENAINMAIESKPAYGKVNNINTFNNIGG